MNGAEKVRQKKNGGGENWRERDTEVDAVDERAMAVFALAGAKGLRNHGV
jgi:hypothetical protein